MTNNYILFYVCNSDIEVISMFINRVLTDKEMSDIKTIMDKHDWLHLPVKYKYLHEAIEEIEGYIHNLNIEIQRSGIQGFD